LPVSERHYLRCQIQELQEASMSDPFEPGKQNDEREPQVLDVPVGIAARGRRIETDSLGGVEVPADRYWGAQTERSLAHFAIGEDRMPKAVYHAYGYIKKAAALVNASFGLPQWKARLIAKVADEVIAGQLDSEFPLYVWQTGSGTHTNMNVNEVISNRAIQLTGGILGSKRPIHPNDDVNLAQSSNDTFQAAMHIATVFDLTQRLIPAVSALRDVIWSKAHKWVDVVKIGRTHLQDATPLTVGQEWSGYAVQLENALNGVSASVTALYQLAIGGTAVGTGVNAPTDFGRAVCEKIAEFTGHPFVSAPNKFAAQASVDAMVAASAALRGLAVALMKIANDLRWLGSGPRAGLHELVLPANEPGSSIMPGKVNPTQEEAMIMICIQVIGEDNAVAFAGSQGNFELNAMRPVIIHNVLHATRILSDACTNFRRHSVEHIGLDAPRISKFVRESLMLVTPLASVIGYDQASTVVHYAIEHDTTLREAALKVTSLTVEEFDRLADPRTMVGNPRRDLGMVP
jgi:fumarate hydratase, class II